MMSLSRIALLIACTLSTLHAQQQPLDLPSLDKPPTLSLPPPKIVPLPADAAVPGGAMAPVTPPPPTQPALPPPVVKDGSTSSTSTNGQFIIHGADLQTRSWFNRFCETLASDLQRLMRDPQPWNIPIVLSLRMGNDMSLTEPSVKAVVSELTSGGFQLQLTVQLRPDLNTNDLRAELIRILLAERILRGHDKLTTTRSRILPEWLLVGATEALRYKERSRPSALFAAVFKTGKIYDIEEILEATPGKLDAMSRAIYETSSCALVLALLDQNEGSLRMAKFLHSLAIETRGDRELINEWFPAVAQSKTSLDKWWSLQMANLARPSVFESLDPVKSIKALDDALTLRFQAEVEVTSSAPSKEGAEAEAEAVEDRPGFFARLFRRSSEKDESIDSKAKPQEMAMSKVEEQPKEPAKPEPTPEAKPTPKPEVKPEAEPQDESKPEEPKRPGLLRRLFSGDDEKEAKQEPEKKSEKPKTTPAPAPKKDDKADEKKTASIASPFWRLAADLTFPAATLVMDAHEWLEQPVPRYAILGFGKKKDAKAEEEDTRKAKPEPAKEEEAKKPEPKREEPKKKEPAKAEVPAAPAPKPTVKTRKVAASLPIEDYAKVLKRSDAKAVFANTAQSLVSLGQRVHPLFRPLINDYVKLISDMADGKTKNADARLQELKQQRTQIAAQARAAQDFVDWYEASQNTNWSGLFDDFLRVPEAVRDELPKRVDPLSRLLDEAEQQAR